MSRNSSASTIGKKEPRPTVARGTGRHTDLAFPTPAKSDEKREVVPRAESSGALGAESLRQS
jgi:hypothetical protein